MQSHAMQKHKTNYVRQTGQTMRVSQHEKGKKKQEKKNKKNQRGIDRCIRKGENTIENTSRQAKA